MFWKELIVVLCVTFVPSYAVIFCHFQNDDAGLYSCNMLIFNPEGGLISNISGNHLTNMTDEDVVQVIAIGITPNISSIICNSFQNLQKMYIEDLGIIGLFNNPFQSCSQLKMLSLRNNTIKTLYPNTFQNTILEELYLDNNLLAEITSDLLEGLNDLKVLSLKGSSQTTFNGSVFEHLTSLTNLDLSYCNFTDLDPEWFEKGLSQLEVLNLAGNLLTDIPADTFQALSGLEILALDFNEISTLNENSFQLPNLKALFLDSNKLENLQANFFKDLLSLEILYLSGNDCSDLPSDIFSLLLSLTTLGMHSASIENINVEWFESLPNLSILLLEENAIKGFPEKAFKSSNNLKFLSVYGNQLSELNSRSFDSVEALSHLDVRNNQINRIDHHLMNQTDAMTVALFADNLCADFDTFNYNLERESYKDQLMNCFDNFDREPIVLVTNNSPSFEWYNIRLNDRWNEIEFNIQASQSAHIGLTDSLNNNDNLLEIRIGEANNTLLQIVEQGEVKSNYPTSNLLSGSEMRAFKIHLGVRYITIYRNNEEIPFYGYFMSNYFDINFFGLKTQIPPLSTPVNADWNVQRIQG